MLVMNLVMNLVQFVFAPELWVSFGPCDDEDPFKEFGVQYLLCC
jgi:hypothetical protein